MKWHPNQSFAELLRHLLNIFWKHEIQARSINVNSHVHLQLLARSRSQVHLRKRPWTCPSRGHSHPMFCSKNSRLHYLYSTLSKVPSPPASATKTRSGSSSRVKDATWVFHLYVLLSFHLHVVGFPGGSGCRLQGLLQCRRPGFDPWGGKIPWRRKGQPTPALLSGKSHGQRSLVGYRPQSHKRVGYNLATKPQHLYVVPKTGKSVQAGSRLVVTFPREKLEVGQGEDKELVLNGDRVSVWDG